MFLYLPVLWLFFANFVAKPWIMGNMGDDNVYKVSKSRTVRYVTVGVWVLLVAVFVPSWYMVFIEPFILVPFVIMLLTTLSVFGILFYYYLISPRSIELAADALVLRRVWGTRSFRYADIAEAALWQGKPSHMFRMWGCGAFCGYIGWFSGGGLGSHFEYVGDYADAFYIKLRSGRTYLLSCDCAGQVVGRLNDGTGKAAV